MEGTSNNTELSQDMSKAQPSEKAKKVRDKAKAKSPPKTTAEGEAKTAKRERKGIKKSKEKTKEKSSDKSKVNSPDKQKAGPSEPRPAKSTIPSGGHSNAKTAKISGGKKQSSKSAKKTGSTKSVNSEKKNNSASNATVNKTDGVERSVPTGESSAPPEQAPPTSLCAGDEVLNESADSLSTAFAKMGIPSPDLSSNDDLLGRAQELVKKVQVMLHTTLGNIERGVVEDLVQDLGNMVTQIALEKTKVECERDSLLHEVLQYRAKPNTYAEAAKADARTVDPSPRTAGKTRTKGPSKEHVLLIYPKGKKGGSGSVEKRLKSLDPAKLNVNPMGTKKVAGGLLVRLDLAAGADNLETAIRNNEELMDVWEVRRPKLRKPQIIVYDVPNDIKKEEVLQQVCAQGDVLDSQV